MRVHLAQCLCGPARHAILATAMPPEFSADEVLEMLRVAVGEVLAGRGAALGMVPRIDAWCGLCGAPASQWVYEVGVSIEYPDWDTAQRELRRVEAENLASRAMIDGLRRSGRN